MQLSSHWLNNQKCAESHKNPLNLQEKDNPNLSSKRRLTPVTIYNGINNE